MERATRIVRRMSMAPSTTLTKHASPPPPERRVMTNRGTPAARETSPADGEHRVREKVGAVVRALHGFDRVGDLGERRAERRDDGDRRLLVVRRRRFDSLRARGHEDPRD